MKKVGWFDRFNAWYQRQRAALDKRYPAIPGAAKVDLTYAAYKAGWEAGRRAYRDTAERT